ncbi:MAG TPA: aminotransferase class III-fold pyridoxal phosphate-dependent enzyme [Candidatus Acidoferrales bacterium]|nr:aminotransferase class III-fold pyridoxal phosphate-dependent enzyme [Candidatus Acidoferrales bacterium]
MLGQASRSWLPFTQMTTFAPEDRCFVRGFGTRLEDRRGRTLFDAVSSIWTIVHGHGHPFIVEAIARQAATLDHATMLGATNPVAESLAQRLCALTRMDRAFFASDGASAVEAALKLALQYWQNAGEPQRQRFVRLRDAYHGDTAGAMSVSDIEPFKSRFSTISFESYDLDAAPWDDVAAVIVEPVVQAAAGMRIVEPARYGRLRGMKPLLIVDEIATGFGRTGSMFGGDALDVTPDLMCLGKGLSGGVLPLSATLASDRVYAAFLGAPDSRRHFFHGHSFAGNPVACAAAVASLELFEREGTLQRAAALARRAASRLEYLARHRLVRDVRQAGCMIGVELRSELLDAGGHATAAWRVADALYDRGQFTRPIGDTIQLVPPLSSSEEEIEEFFDALEAELA